MRPHRNDGGEVEGEDTPQRLLVTADAGAKLVVGTKIWKISERRMRLIRSRSVHVPPSQNLVAEQRKFRPYAEVERRAGRANEIIEGHAPFGRFDSDTAVGILRERQPWTAGMHGELRIGMRLHKAPTGRRLVDALEINVDAPARAIAQIREMLRKPTNSIQRCGLMSGSFSRRKQRSTQRAPSASARAALSNAEAP